MISFLELNCAEKFIPNYKEGFFVEKCKHESGPGANFCFYPFLNFQKQLKSKNNCQTSSARSATLEDTS